MDRWWYPEYISLCFALDTQRILSWWRYERYAQGWERALRRRRQTPDKCRCWRQYSRRKRARRGHGRSCQTLCGIIAYEYPVAEGQNLLVLLLRRECGLFAMVHFRRISVPVLLPSSFRYQVLWQVKNDLHSGRALEPTCTYGHRRSFWSFLFFVPFIQCTINVGLFWGSEGGWSLTRVYR